MANKIYSFCVNYRSLRCEELWTADSGQTVRGICLEHLHVLIKTSVFGLKGTVHDIW